MILTYTHFISSFFVILTVLMIFSWLSFIDLLNIKQEIYKRTLYYGFIVAILVSVLALITVFFVFYGYYKFNKATLKKVFVLMTIRMYIICLLLPISWIDVKELWNIYNNVEEESIPSDLVYTSGAIAIGTSLMFILTLIHILKRYVYKFKPLSTDI